MVFENFDTIYNNIKNKECGFHEFHKERYRIVMSLIPDISEKNVVDFGASDTTVELMSFLNPKKLVTITHPSYNLLSEYPFLEKINADLDNDKNFLKEKFEIAFCMETLEHLSQDPNNLLNEINLSLEDKGLLIFSVPNICSERSVARILKGLHPQLTAGFDCISHNRHNREYTVEEVRELMKNSGFEILDFRTIYCYTKMGSLKEVKIKNGGDSIFAIAKKVGPMKDRFPSWLYYNKKF